MKKNKATRSKLKQQLEDVSKLYYAGTLAGRYAMLGQLVNIRRQIGRSPKKKKAFLKATAHIQHRKSGFAHRLLKLTCPGIKRGNLTRYSAVLDIARSLKLDGDEVRRRLSEMGLSGFVSRGGDPMAAEKSDEEDSEKILTAARVKSRTNPDYRLTADPSNKEWAVLLARRKKSGRLCVFAVADVEDKAMSKIICSRAKHIVPTGKEAN